MPQGLQDASGIASEGQELRRPVALRGLAGIGTDLRQQLQPCLEVPSRGQGAIRQAAAVVKAEQKQHLVTPRHLDHVADVQMRDQAAIGVQQYGDVFLGNGGRAAGDAHQMKEEILILCRTEQSRRPGGQRPQPMVVAGPKFALPLLRKTLGLVGDELAQKIAVGGGHDGFLQFVRTRGAR
ncbi:hypothetical protein [Pseudogemmobacter humi]|uniref:hypothetical protein n=1 Tax=Pseudogemmobacter humi TaxID=2483812 RepID=UPI000F548D19